MDTGGAEVLLFFVFIYGVVAFALYWVIRLAVRHAIEDAHSERSARSAAAVSETIRRQRATYGGSDPE